VPGRRRRPRLHLWVRCGMRHVLLRLRQTVLRHRWPIHRIRSLLRHPRLALHLPGLWPRLRLRPYVCLLRVTLHLPGLGTRRGLRPHVGLPLRPGVRYVRSNRARSARAATWTGRTIGRPVSGGAAAGLDPICVTRCQWFVRWRRRSGCHYAAPAELRWLRGGRN
jgi:hypothetical protein